MSDGIIVKQLSNFYYVEEDGQIYETKARGKFRLKSSPVVGDKVVLNEEKNYIIDIKQRKNLLNRPTLSNVDYLIIFVARENPKPDYGMIDKLVVSAVYNNIEPIIIVNKIDLNSESLNYSFDDLEISYMSVKNKEDVEGWLNRHKNGIYALAGPSGAGKSSFINAIHSKQILKTGELSKKISRGKHTTRHTELITVREGMYIADTPGFQRIDLLESITAVELADIFYKDTVCHFKDCLHISEPSCGADKSDKDKYNRYLALQKEIKERKKW